MTFQAQRRHFLATALALGAAPFAHGQTGFPDKPIRLVVPYAAGAVTDILARMLAAGIGDSLGQPLVVDNRPGGRTVIGARAMLSEPHDGHTLLLVSASHVVLDPAQTLPYDPVADFAAVGTLGSNEFLLVVPAAFPADTLQEFIAAAKAKPDQLSYSSAGNGSASHLAGELFKSLAGVQIRHVPYKGGMPALNDLLGGFVQMSFQGPAAALPMIKAGRLKALAYASNTRLPALPQVPTFAEAGLPDYSLKIWFGILAPADTPRPVVERLSAEIAKVVRSPDVHDKMLKIGINPLVTNPAQFDALMRADKAKFDRLIKTAHIKFGD
jgi:tripartite-type tricarboxylate transporter receptor subunit TctC